jgi:hypothetical protein
MLGCLFYVGLGRFLWACAVDPCVRACVGFCKEKDRREEKVEGGNEKVCAP